MADNRSRFEGKVAVVTGGGRGIGRACALRFVREGARVAVLDILPDQARNTAREAEALGHESLAIDCDVRDADQLAAAVEQVMAAWDRIDIWVNNAGVYTGSPLLEVAPGDWDDTVGTNFTGVFLGCRAVAPIMRQQRFGRIINISAVGGGTSGPATAEYSASKSAVIGLTRSVALDMAPYGVTVNAVCPGDTLTEMLHQVASAAAPREGMTPEAWLSQRAKDCPLGRLATPDEIAGPVAFLASDEARYFTGQSIGIDGGVGL
jgi:NAD(P)-dependent dehydrogenase (short-subunit alcohol dehydrogenase family)